MGKRGHGEGSIYQRSDGRWAASITLEGGNRKRKTFYGKTRKEVQEKLRVALNDQKQGTLVTGPKQTLETYLYQWLEDVYKPTVRSSTYVQYKWAIRRHLVPALGNITLQKLTPERVQTFYARLLEEGLKASTIGVVHAVLHKALENAVRWNLVARNVSSLVSLPRIVEHEVQALTPEQARTLVEAAKGYRIEALIILALATGARHGELLALRWQDVDLERKVLHIRHTVTRLGGYGFVENEPKTRSGRRRITLPDFAVDALKAHRLKTEEVRLEAGDKWVEQGLVFPNIYGGFINPSVVRRWFRVILKKAGLPDMRFHDLRHSAATILLTMGVHPKAVQERLGHSNITMTMNTYSHVLPSVQQDVASKMDDALRET